MEDNLVILWRSWTGGCSAVLAAKTSHILSCICSLQVRGDNSSLVTRHLWYLFTMYNCQVRICRKAECRFFSQVKQNRNKGNRHWKFQLDKGKIFLPCRWSKCGTQFCPGRLWDLHKYSARQDPQQHALVGFAQGRKRLYWSPPKVPFNLLDSRLVKLKTQH